MSKKHPYYNYNRLNSYNGTYNFLVGGRGLGKTYGAKKRAISDALTKDAQFIYLRRYKTEMQAARNTFFADVQHEFPDYDFKVHGNLAQASSAAKRNDKKREWLTIGYFIALSTSQKEKSVSYPKVKTIIFDEFLIEKGTLHYLPNETTIFTNFYSTVDRYQDKTRVYFLANSVSIMNPYFIDYKIEPDSKREFIVKADGFIVCHFPNSEAFNTSVYETRFGRFIKDTEYADYAVGNSFDDNNSAMLESKDSRARYMFTLECANGVFSVWLNMFNNEYFIQDKLPKTQEIFTLVPSKMDKHKTLMTYSDPPLAYLRAAFRQGSVSFDNPTTRNTFAEIFKR